MSIVLGSEWPTRSPVEPQRRQITADDLRTEQILAALQALHQALASMPAPVVHVSEPDLSDVVQAVVGLRSNEVTADQIAEAVVGAIGGGTQPEIEPVLKQLTEALERLDFRLKGIAAMGGGGGGVGSHVVNKDGTALDTLEARQDRRYEWQSVAGSSVPLYIGSALPGTATSAPAWRIDRYSYITGPAGDAVPSFVQSATGAWSDRASLF